MNIEKLCHPDAEVSARYVVKKFSKFNGWAYPKSMREKKCIEYYLAAEGPPDRQDVVDTAYQRVFKQLFPHEKAEQVAQARARAAARMPVRREAGERMECWQEELDESRRTLQRLNKWKDAKEYQMGDGFMSQLKSAVGFLEEDLMKEEALQVEYDAFRVASLTSVAQVGDGSFKGEFDAMVGLKQQAALRFTVDSPRLGEISGKLEESFKAGAWAKGSAAGKMSSLGFSTDMQLAVALGAHLEMSGDLTWKKGVVGLQLEGAAEVFMGAKADASLKLSAHALKGIEMAIAAGAFAGFKAEASGSCSFTYHNQKLVTASGSAGVTFGVGAEFSASLKAPIFGPTEVSFSGNATLLTGVTSSTKLAINFGGIYLAGRSEFQRLLYLPTIARGYSMEIMTQDAENLFYLNKCIVRVAGHIEELEGRIVSVQRTPMEKRSLLM